MWNLYIPMLSISLSVSCISLQYTSLNYIDEGNTYLSLLRHHSLGLSKVNKVFVSISRLMVFISDQIWIILVLLVIMFIILCFLTLFAWYLIFTYPKFNISHFHPSTLISSTLGSIHFYYLLYLKMVGLNLSFRDLYCYPLSFSFPSLDTLVVKPHYRDRLSKFSLPHGAADDVLFGCQYSYAGLFFLIVFSNCCIFSFKCNLSIL